MNCVLKSLVTLSFLGGIICPNCFASSPLIIDNKVAEGNILTPEAEADLFNAIDFARPQLAPANVAYRHNDRKLADKELADYFRKRSFVGWRFDVSASRTVSPQNQTIADNAVKGELQGGMVPLNYSFPNGQIDWHFNATDHTPGQSHNDEWEWQLNRMSFWADLAAAYRGTGDERYAEAFVREMRSWIEQCPVPQSAANGPGSAWRTIEAGIRMGGSWMDAFYAFRNSPAMSDEDLLAFVHSFLDHGRYLQTRHTRLNWLTLEMNGLYAVGAVFPEFKDASEWRHDAATTLAEEARKQFLPDGAQIELSTGYQNVVLDTFFHVFEIASWTGTSSDLPPSFLDPLEKAYGWQVSIVAPDRYLPKINDSWPVYLPFILRKAAVGFPSQPSFQWFASNGRQGSPPSYTSAFLNWSGFAAMRSSWETSANYLIFRVGPLGLGHQHQDSLGVDIWSYGRELLFNGGGGSYEKSKWRQWAVSALGHNTLVVDDMPQTRTMRQDDAFHDPNMVSQGPIDAHWESNGTYDFATGEYDGGYGPSHQKIASQTRDVLFLKPDIFIVADRVTPKDSASHSYQARWQLLTKRSRIQAATQVLITEDPGMPNIAVVPLLVNHLQVRSASGQEEPEILGWDVRKDVTPQLVPATTLLHTLTGPGPQTILTMFVPLRTGEEDPVKRVVAGADGASATVIFADGRRFVISCPATLGIAVQETLPNGKEGRSVASH